MPNSTSNKIVIFGNKMARHHNQLVESNWVNNRYHFFCLLFQNQSFEWSLICDEFFLVKLEFFYHLISDCSYSTMNFRTFSLRSEQTIFLFQTIPVLSSTCSGGAIPPFTSVVRFLATSTNCVSAATTLTQSPSRTRGFSCWDSKSQRELSCLWRSS